MWANDKIRFLAIGAINTAVGYALFAAIHFAVGTYISYFGSLIASHLLASTLAFVLYRRVVFQVTGDLWRDYWRFQSVYAGSFAANLVLLPFLVTGLGWNTYIAQALSVSVIAVSSYVGHRLFSFKR